MLLVANRIVRLSNADLDKAMDYETNVITLLLMDSDISTDDLCTMIDIEWTKRNF